jgi:hypothetical protein
MVPIPEPNSCRDAYIKCRVYGLSPSAFAGVVRVGSEYDRTRVPDWVRTFGYRSDVAP